MFILFFLLFLASKTSQAADENSHESHSLNSPPTISVDRNWEVSHSAPIGTLVRRVTAYDLENDTLEFGLEHSTGYNIVQSDPSPLPLTINQTTGYVYTNQSLSHAAGEDIFLYVTVTDGHQTSKTQVWLKITNGSNPQASPPHTLPHFTKRPLKIANISHILGYNKTNTVAQPTTPLDELLLVSNPISETTPVRDNSIYFTPAIGVLISFFAISAITVFLFRKRIFKVKKYRANKVESNQMAVYKEKKEELPVFNDIRTTSIDKWEFPRHRLKIFNMLGEGAFGQVWRCEAINIDGNTGNTMVALKMLKQNASEQDRLDLLKEIEVMKSLEAHPNVVRLLGCCSEKDPVYVILEYMEQGKLQSFLRRSRAQRNYNNLHGLSNSLTSQDLTSFCYQIAKGMQYLSSMSIIHRDLAARNVLVSADRICKIADFGFARDRGSQTYGIYERKSSGKLPIRWMPPESLYDNVFSVKSDVWSYGVTIWEVVTLGSTPYPGMASEELMSKVRDGYRLSKPPHCKRELYNIMYYCWHGEPSKRPDFNELVGIFEELLEKETDYIQLDQFPDHSYYNMVSVTGELL